MKTKPTPELNHHTVGVLDGFITCSCGKRYKSLAGFHNHLKIHARKESHGNS
jgi:hypothetical protein